MEIICIELQAWEKLKQQIGRLAADMKVLKELYCPNPRDG
ncbi:hypothetical protein EZS27_012831 [termite gut metagenome]|jgi:hypothetical protein|uniref:Uncharacterized protein n=1 Tax=termite gut metagenome TaxID=433724 RepID=A0A5J4RZ48_9ZZZZ